MRAPKVGSLGDAGTVTWCMDRYIAPCYICILRHPCRKWSRAVFSNFKMLMIDISNIPDWARWMAMDEDGFWWCYEAEPHQHDKGWYENEVGRSWKINAGQLQTLAWRDSLKKLNL